MVGAWVFSGMWIQVATTMSVANGKACVRALLNWKVVWEASFFFGTYYFGHKYMVSLSDCCCCCCCVRILNHDANMLLIYYNFSLA